jgi:hypothetical protein
MARSRRKNKRRKRSSGPKPFTPVKMKFFQLSDPFEGLSRQERLEIIRAFGERAKRRFAELFPQLEDWFKNYDAPYLLSFCALHFLSSPEGIDREAIEGKLDFYHHHLELLQAFALMRERSFSAAPMLNKAGELLRFLKDLDESILSREFAFPENITPEEISKRQVLTEMRLQTTSVRNWAYPDQMVRVVGVTFEGVGQSFAEAFGIEPQRIVSALQKLAEACEDKLNQHVEKLRQVWIARNYQDAWARYCQSFPDLQCEPGDGKRIFEQVGRNERQFKSMLTLHSDLLLPAVFTFSLSQFGKLYGPDANLDRLRAILEQWSLAFGDLRDHRTEHFILDNPVLRRPFIKLEPDVYFCPLVGILYHLLQGLMEGLLRGSGDQRLLQRYERSRSRFLEDEVEKLLRDALPNGAVFRGSKWQDPESGKTYENDVLAVLPPFACVVECKSGSVDPPARRGAEYRLVDTLEDLVVASSVQANRFTEFLSANPGVHEFLTERGELNQVDNREVRFYAPLSITYENLGTISANLKSAAEAGLIETLPDPLVPSICFTDLEIIAQLLRNEIELFHYLTRRAQIEHELHYRGDEMDLLAFYLETAFNITGESQEGKPLAISLILKSKELDPYFTGRIAGRKVEKPRLDLTSWWRDILGALVERKPHRWAEVGFALLNVAKADQVRLEQLIQEQAAEIRQGLAKPRHNWMVLKTGSANRAYGVVAFPYGEVDRTERNDMINNALADAAAADEMLGLVCIGVRAQKPGYPYDVLAYLPGEEIRKIRSQSSSTEVPP